MLGRALDWHFILQRLRAEEAWPLFYRNLSVLGCPGVPASVRETMHYLAKMNALRNTLLTEELVRLLQLVGDAGIPVIPLKGVALAESIYGDPSLRVCSDIDFLVPRQAAGRAVRLLLAEGFEDAENKSTIADIGLLLNSNIEYVLVSRKQGFSFTYELHWDVAWRWRGNDSIIDDLWAEAGRHVYWGTEGHELSPEWQLLYLALHAARHQWQGLKWLVDIHEVILCSRFEWKKLRAKAERLGLERILFLTLGACHTVLRTPMPQDFSATKLPKWLKLFPARSNPADIWEQNLFPVRLFPRLSEKLRYLARVLLVPTLAEQRDLGLPQFLRFLYYPLRPLRLVCKWSSAQAASRLGLGAGQKKLGAGSKKQGARSKELEAMSRSTRFGTLDK